MQTAWESLKPINWRETAKQIAHRDSIENKVLEFFDRNPGEELFVTDACAKFNATDLTHMRKLLKSMVDRSLLTRVWVGDCYAYRAGLLQRGAA